MKADNPVRETGGCRIYLIVMALCIVGIYVTLTIMKTNEPRSNRDYCPECNERWEDCPCENIYPEDSLINQDDQDVESGFNIF